MLEESKELITNLDRYFLRKWGWRYKIIVVNNHYFDVYSFFLQSWKSSEMLRHIYDLVEFTRNESKYEEVIKDLKEHSKLTIEYRDTHHLIMPGNYVNQDSEHGHGHL